MTIADYTDMSIVAGEYAGRSDYGYMFPRFVAFCEGKMNRRLRVGKMEEQISITTDANGEATLPADYLEMRIVTTPQGIPIEMWTPVYAAEQFGPLGGSPCAYTVSGDTFTCVPKSATTFNAVYFKAIPPLSPSNTSNWLLEDAPLIYVYGVAAEIVGWALATGKETDRDRLAGLNMALDAEINAYREMDSSRRYSNARVMQRGMIV